ncbi:uncharacterized protein LOC125298311, partial [Alosa alosa]|uniref:uncharacterized protein LOC125298311 n=1 Tax=Alosa alosa TaxID=278164 RepID=UPI0020151414
MGCGRLGSSGHGSSGISFLATNGLSALSSRSRRSDLSGWSRVRRIDGFEHSARHPNGRMSQTILDVVTSVLPKLDEERLRSLLERLLLVVCIEEVQDLCYVTEDDIKDILTPCQYRKFLDAFRRRGVSSVMPPTTSSPPLPAPSPPSAASSSSSLSAISTSSQWIQEFQVPWGKMPVSLRNAMSQEQRAAQPDRLQMIRVIIDAVRLHCVNPTRAQCAEIARTVVAQYPKTFGDVTDEGELLGCGYTSLLNQLKTRVEHVNRNNTLARIRKPKRANPESIPQKNSFNKLDSYGCVDWQPQDLPEGETSDSLEVKRQMLVTLYKTEGPRRVDMVRVDDLMQLTYVKQRDLINSSPPPQVSTILEEWPFLSQKRWLCLHFEKLTGIDLLSRLTEAFLSKGRRIVNFFLQQRLKWKGDIQSLLTEIGNDTRTLDDTNLMAISAILLLMAFFREQTDSLFILADVTETVADIEGHERLPDTPRLIMLGPSLMTAKRWMVSIEGTVAITFTGSDSFPAAFAT